MQSQKTRKKNRAAAQDLYQRVVTFAEYFKKIRDDLESGNKAFNQAVGSYAARIRPAGKRVQELSGGTYGKELADVPLLETTLKLPSAD